MGTFSNPAVLTIILGAFGGAITWLWTQVSKAATKHRECEVKLARVEAEMVAQAEKLGIMQGTCSTLTELLRKEVHIAS